MKILMLLIISLFALPCWAESQILDWIEFDKEFPSGCGCSVTDKQGHFLVASDLGGTVDQNGFIIWSPAIIKLNGKRHELKCISSTDRHNVKPKRGRRFSVIYENGPIHLVLNYKTTFTCPPKSEDCEVIRYAVDAVLTLNGQTHKLTGLRGDCGC